MIQKVYKYIAYCDLNSSGETDPFALRNIEDHLGNTEVVIKGNTIDELMDKIEAYYFHYQAWCDLEDEGEMEAQHLDETICIGDLQFITYTGGKTNE